MKVANETPLPPGNDAWGRSLVASLIRRFNNLVDALNGNLGFGDGTSTENIRGVWITYTTNATPDTEDIVAHDLGVVPLGYLVFQQDKAGVLYSGGTAWTSSNVYLKCSAASVTVKLFLLT